MTPSERTAVGLMLPAALASSWGVSYARNAKAVWFRMAVAERARGQAGARLRVDGRDVRAHGAARAGPDAADGARRPMPGTRTIRWPPSAGSAMTNCCGTPWRPHATRRAPTPRMRSSPTRTASCGYGQAPGSGTRSCWSASPAPRQGSRRRPHDEDGSARLPAVYDDLGRLAADVPAASDAARSLVTVPFLAEGRVTGMLAAAAAEPDRFTHADAEHLQHGR